MAQQQLDEIILQMKVQLQEQNKIDTPVLK